jgi:hypothetical protein
VPQPYRTQRSRGHHRNVNGREKEEYLCFLLQPEEQGVYHQPRHTLLNSTCPELVILSSWCQRASWCLKNCLQLSDFHVLTGGLSMVTRYGRFEMWPQSSARTVPTAIQAQVVGKARSRLSYLAYRSCNSGRVYGVRHCIWYIESLELEVRDGILCTPVGQDCVAAVSRFQNLDI